MSSTLSRSIYLVSSSTYSKNNQNSQSILSQPQNSQQSYDSSSHKARTRAGGGTGGGGESEKSHPDRSVNRRLSYRNRPTYDNSPDSNNQQKRRGKKKSKSVATAAVDPSTCVWGAIKYQMLKTYRQSKRETSRTHSSNQTKDTDATNSKTGSCDSNDLRKLKRCEKGIRDAIGAHKRHLWITTASSNSSSGSKSSHVNKRHASSGSDNGRYVSYGNKIRYSTSNYTNNNHSNDNRNQLIERDVLNDNTTEHCNSAGHCSKASQLTNADSSDKLHAVEHKSNRALKHAPLSPVSSPSTQLEHQNLAGSPQAGVPSVGWPSIYPKQTRSSLLRMESGKELRLRNELLSSSRNRRTDKLIDSCNPDNGTRRALYFCSKQFLHCNFA